MNVLEYIQTKTINTTSHEQGNNENYSCIWLARTKESQLMVAWNENSKHCRGILIVKLLFVYLGAIVGCFYSQVKSKGKEN